ncbi:hypothetical protein BYT27DRAFT_7255253 [Phlegmacium glaucopus]|nr:hypothetical protein BYT27DRAFT_7255253 [Phlegmacium glaucopus]
MCTATLAHRAEIMDDHMTDSNHKKSLQMAESLAAWYIQAMATSQTAEIYYQNLVKGISLDNLDGWEEQILHTEKT